MSTTLGFDVYGTLIDTNGVVEALTGFVGEQAAAFSKCWRDKQLEYSFRRGLMRHYDSFAVCVRQALDYTCAAFRVPLDESQKALLLKTYRTLPPFKDAAAGLGMLQHGNFRMYAFSNGTADTVERLLDQAGLLHFFLGVISVDDIRSFKPDPAVYAHFLRKTGSTGNSAWLISGNPFDLIGALSTGLNGAWVRRNPDAIFDPWGIEPSLTVHALTDLAHEIPEFEKRKQVLS
ncbi:MAG: haloacid dehalogenase type II [Betaproteobacteria bacterium]|nr:haloacid dehalogenase type II [Betaproteobacteria bacterium]MDE2622664.1 haloacid dehalogenase type II [Betaproteobacteria bacterium]